LDERIECEDVNALFWKWVLRLGWDWRWYGGFEEGGDMIF
jgi:hypothetical protein